MKRRSFLKRLASAGILLPSVSGLPSMRAFAQSVYGSPFLRSTVAGSDRVMVIVRLFGGNDGLNTLVPFTNDLYYSARARGTSSDISIAPKDVLRISGSDTLGFHPSLSLLRDLQAEGKMAIVQNVGYPNQDLSHFRSTDIWLSGSDADVYRTSGWYARYLEAKFPNYPEELPPAPFAIEMDTYLGTSLIGERGDMGIALSDLSYIPGGPEDEEEVATNAGIEEEFIRETMRESSIFLETAVKAYRGESQNRVPYPKDTLIGQQLSSVARMIAGGLGTQLYVVNVDGFDTHFDQQKRHGYLLGYIANAMHAFQRDIEAFGLGDRVCMMTISEFGRRVASNGSGTDHGAAAPLFVIGHGVNSGIIGNDPDLADLDAAGNLKMAFDFRQIYASVLGQWFGADETEMVPQAFPREFSQLPIFRQTTTAAADDAAAGTLRLEQSVPNPASSAATIRVDGVPAGTTAELAVHTLEGRQVLARPVHAWEREIILDVRDLPAGPYLYTLRSGRFNRSRVMIVQR